MPLSLENFSYLTFLSSDFGDSFGSGFKLKHLNREFIITAKHVIYKDETLRKDLLVTSQNYVGEEHEMYSINVDLEKAKVKNFGTSDLVLIEIEKDISYDINQTGNDNIFAEIDCITCFENIKIASKILLVGFPTSLINDDFFDINRPLLRTGIIAGINSKSKTFIIDSPAFYGNSGGPVIQIGTNNEMQIVGIVSRYVPFLTEWKNKHEKEFLRQEFYNSGYAICLPLDEIINFIKI